jgi:hypothetical protein
MPNPPNSPKSCLPIPNPPNPPTALLHIPHAPISGSPPTPKSADISIISSANLRTLIQEEKPVQIFAMSLYECRKQGWGWVTAGGKKVSNHFSKRGLETRGRAITSTSERRRQEGERSLQQVSAGDKRASDHFNKRTPETGAPETGGRTENRGLRRMGEVEEL